MDFNKIAHQRTILARLPQIPGGLGKQSLHIIPDVRMSAEDANKLLLDSRADQMLASLTSEAAIERQIDIFMNYESYRSRRK